MATKADLQREVSSLQPYQFAFFALRRGLKPIKLKDDNLDRERRRYVEILNPGSPTGGVVIEGSSCRWAGDWCATAHRSNDAWSRELAHQVHKLQREALQKES